MQIQTNISLAPYTTFKIGGPARYFIIVNDRQDLQSALLFAQQKRINWFLLGNGSNLLVADRGYSGLVIKNNLNKIKISANKDNPIITAGSGVQLNHLILFCLKHHLVGLHHFAYIPGTIGGALFINAHYLDYFIGDYVIGGRVLGSDGSIVSWQQSDFKFGYDTSSLKIKQFILLEADFKLKPGNVVKAKQEMKTIMARRRAHPPLSAGCVWQNLSQSEQDETKLAQGAVGYLIDQKLGLKGKRIGQAQISRRHAAFIENLGGAKASDVFALLLLTRNKVWQKYRVKLRLEIELLGFTKPELNKIIN